MAVVKKRDGEDLESMIRRFNRKVNDDKTLNELKKHEFYVSPGQKRREKKKEAEQKRRKASRQQRAYSYRGTQDDDKKFIPVNSPMAD